MYVMLCRVIEQLNFQVWEVKFLSLEKIGFVISDAANQILIHTKGAFGIFFL